MKRQALYPSFFARFYDTIYHQMRDSADHDYFLNKIKSVTGPVLEIGVGTGRFLLMPENRELIFTALISVRRWWRC